MSRKPMAARLQEKFTIDFQSGCWNWRGGSNGNGYGRMFDGHKLRPAHQIAYELANGPIPEGLEIDHLCRNRGCMNPAHMQAVTPQDHMRRHWKTHCKRGHPLSGDNLRIIVRGKRMMRICRECNRARKRAYYYGQPLEG